MTRPSRTSTWGARGSVFPTGAGRAASVISSILVLFSGRAALRGVDAAAAHEAPREREGLQVASAAAMEEP